MQDKHDLTQGGITNKLLFIALPIMGTQLMQMAYNLTDMFWLGMAGNDEVAASGTVGMYMWLAAGFMMFGRMGAEIGVSQNIGRGNRAESARYGEEAIRVSMVLGTAWALVMMLFRTPLIGFFRIPEAHVDAMAQSYMLAVAAFAPLTFVTSAITGCFTASGNSKIPFCINGIGLVLNMALDPIMIFGFGMGIVGAAAATVVSAAAACGVGVYVFKYSKYRPFEDLKILSRPNPARIRRIFTWSTPIALESMLFTSLSMIVSRYVAAWGSSAIAVFRVGTQVESLTWLIGEGFASADTAFMGQNYGAKRWGRIHKGFRASLLVMTGWGLIVSVVLFMGAGPLIGIFLRGREVLQMGTDYLRIAAISQVFMCLEFVSGGTFRGLGKTLPPSLVSVSANAARVPLAKFMSGALGLNGIWWALGIGAMARGMCMFLWYLVYSRGLPRSDEGV